MHRLILIGSGGHALSVADSLDRSRYALCGCINEVNDLTLPGIPLVGKSLEDIPGFRDYLYFIAFGDNANRKRWFQILRGENLPLISIVDPSALVSAFAAVGEGNFIGRFAVVNAGARIGDNNIINTRALVEHGSRIGSHVHLATGSVVNGNVVIEDLVFLGSCAVCNNRIHVGEGAVVGSGAVVIRDIPAGATAVGNPARVIRNGQTS